MIEVISIEFVIHINVLSMAKASCMFIPNFMREGIPNSSC